MLHRYVAERNRNVKRVRWDSLLARPAKMLHRYVAERNRNVKRVRWDSLLARLAEVLHRYVADRNRNVKRVRWVRHCYPVNDMLIMSRNPSDLIISECNRKAASYAPEAGSVCLHTAAQVTSH